MPLRLETNCLDRFNSRRRFAFDSPTRLHKQRAVLGRSLGEDPLDLQAARFVELHPVGFEVIRARAGFDDASRCVP